MNSTYKEICQEFGLDENRALGLPDQICKEAFFNRLAEHGVNVQSEAQAMQLLRASDALEEKTASLQQRHDPVQGAVNLLLGSTKQAAIAADPGFQRKQASISYIQSMMQDPHYYAALLANTVAQQQ